MSHDVAVPSFAPAASPHGDLAAASALRGVARLTATGHDGDAPTIPPGLPVALAELGRRVETLTALVGRAVEIDPHALIAERAEAVSAGHIERPRWGTTYGGRGRLVEAADGWLAVSLARDSDLEAVPAWLETNLDAEVWSVIERAAVRRSVAELVERAGWLELPCGAVGEVPNPGPLLADRAGSSPNAFAGALVVNLASLWAGPLCAQLLRRAGARVVDVEHIARPDGARLGPRSFYRSLHHGHEHAEFDFGTAAGRAALRDLVAQADVVIEGSRPRALQQLGIDAPAVISAHGTACWVSITAYGRGQDAAHRVGFGDDAAAAGGLVGWQQRTDGRPTPCFLADAIADPLTGLSAAAAVLDAYARGQRGTLIDVSLAETAARCAAGAP